MSRDAQAVSQRRPITEVVARVIQREMTRSRSARLRAERRRARAQRVREFERVALEIVPRS
ncbi:MAG: hypothetical protein AB7K36_26285 [Chloroflexota bacterium]